MKTTRTKKPLTDLLTDVSIREGSQQEIDLRNASVDTKLELMGHIIQSGIKRIEVAAFAPGGWFSDAEELVQRALSRVSEDVILRALYFNTGGLSLLKKYPRILQEGIFLTAATSKYREKNYGQRSADHAKTRMNRLVASFKQHNLEFDTLVMSTAWGECNEALTPARTLDYTIDYLTDLLSSAGNQKMPVRSVTLADTMGCATPEAIQSLIKQVKTGWPDMQVRVHLHPMPGTDEECILAAMEGGAEQWEASWCGLGGSPFADEAGGNLDIRRLIKVYNTLRLTHGFDEAAVDRIVHFLKNHTRRDIPAVRLF
jgi:hydroxymethylglutaryl-CoA lyase